VDIIDEFNLLTAEEKSLVRKLRAAEAEFAEIRRIDRHTRNETIIRLAKTVPANADTATILAHLREAYSRAIPTRIASLDDRMRRTLPSAVSVYAQRNVAHAKLSTAVARK